MSQLQPAEQATDAGQPLSRLWSMREDSDLGLHSSGIRLRQSDGLFKLDQLSIWRSGDRQRQQLAQDPSLAAATRRFERLRLQRLIAGANPDGELNPLLAEELGQPIAAQDVVVQSDPPQPAVVSDRIFAAVARAPGQVPLRSWPAGERLLLSVGPSWVEVLSYGNPASPALALTARQRAAEGLRYALRVDAAQPRPTALIDALWAAGELWLLDLLGLDGSDLRDSQPYSYRRRLLEQLVHEELHDDRGAISVLSASEAPQAQLLIDGEAVYGRGWVRCADKVQEARSAPA